MRKHAHRFLRSLLIAAIGLTAFATIDAQAESLVDIDKAAEFLVNKETVLAKAGVTFEANQLGRGTLSVPGKNLGLLCEVGEITGEFISSKEAKGKASFWKCSTWEFAKVEEGKEHTKKIPCTVSEPIETESIRILPRKYEGEVYLRLQPTGEVFSTITLTGTECTLPKESKISGALSVKVDSNNAVNPKLLSSEKIQKPLGSKLLFGAFETYLTSEWKLRLADAAHIGTTVGILATVEEFLVNKETALAKAGVTFEANQLGRGVLSVSGKFGLLCEVGTMAGEFVNSKEAKGKASFSKCSTWEFAKVEEGKEHTQKIPCTVAEPILTSSIRIFPEKHEGESYLRLLPAEEIFTVLTFTGAECPLAKENKIMGALSAKLDNDNTAEPTLLFSEAIQKLMGSKLPFGVFEGYIKSEWKLKLTGTHVGKTVGTFQSGI